MSTDLKKKRMKTSAEKSKKVVSDEWNIILYVLVFNCASPLRGQLISQYWKMDFDGESFVNKTL